ncbi:phosphoenolpyruvate synthase [Candidatus Babeliales bacterium]|nr:phosphoenolpyruvate synthase [Candidatus Babeliales bacterium]
MKYIKWFEDLRIEDVPLVGGKNASLGEMINALTSKGILIPSGFATTADAYWLHLRENNLEDLIKNDLLKVDKKNVETLKEIGARIRKVIIDAPFPKKLSDEIVEAYKEIKERYKNSTFAVRSSATAEDLPEASFAGQQETFLNIRDEKNLLIACKKALASLFTDRAISYRIDHGFDHMKVALSVGVQQMVRSDKASSGVIFTLDTETGFKNVVLINSSYGIGESVVAGLVNPDEFYVHKETLKKGFRPMLKKHMGAKKTKIIYSDDNEKPTKTVDVSEQEQKQFSLNDDEILKLAKQALMIEEYYSEKKDQWTPMDVEWAKDGIDGKLYIVQARPETVHSRKKETVLEEYILQEKGEVIIKGKAIGRKISSGIARVIETARDMHQLKEGEILVTDMTDPDWEPIMKHAAGIVTNRGGRTCHAAIVSREIGIPAIVGTSNATSLIKTGEEVTIDCSNGEGGFIYKGQMKFEVKKTVLKEIPKISTKIMMNVANPDEAFGFALLPNDGVGLARLEFIINNSVYVHPMALVHPERVEDKDVLAKIEDLTFGYEDKKEFFIDKLAQETGTIAAAFYPKPVIVRFSDFKSNEYKKLLGGEFFEPEESNPMIGFRGASRYYHEKYEEAFALECLAMKKIREEMGLDNVKLMIPFVRTVEEAKTVIQEMAKYGLKQGENGLSVIMMCELPSNVILIEEFSKVFDGFSIGSNDLTQTTLAIDRDSDLVAPLFDERNAAVKKMMEMAIKGANKCSRPIGICGQAPSDYPEIAKFLIDCGIDSISLNPDTVLKTILALAS